MKVNMSEARQRAEDSGLLGDGPWKPKEGDNRFRIVSEFLEHPGEFKGKDGRVKKTFKWLCYIIDRKTGAVKPYFMPDTVYQQIADLQLDQDYQFEEVPMPYDITLKVKNPGTLDVEYNVVPSPKRAELSAAELALISGFGSIRDYQKTVYENQPAPANETPAETAGPIHEEVPLPSEPPPAPERYKSIPPKMRPTPKA